MGNTILKMRVKEEKQPTLTGLFSSMQRENVTPSTEDIFTRAGVHDQLQVLGPKQKLSCWGFKSWLWTQRLSFTSDIFSQVHLKTH